jgi:hypothetical protein
MENNIIIRKYPTIKDERLYRDRYNKEEFEKYKEIIKSIENYEKWKIGINYKTNRKIKIGGKKHIQFGYENFYIKHRTLYDGYSYILYTKLDSINIDSYIQDTEKLEEEILSHNVKINELICKINKLEKWNDFVEFEGIKYGVQKIYNNIHRENDCNGNINETEVCVRECRECRGTTSFTEPCRCEYKTNIECVKCGYKE